MIEDTSTETIIIENMHDAIMTAVDMNGVMTIKDIVS
jgi:hypothetical protein